RLDKRRRIGRAWKNGQPGFALLGVPRLLVERGQDPLLAAVGHGGQGGAHEAPPANAEPSTANLEAGLVAEPEAFDLEAGWFERRHDPLFPASMRDITTHSGRDHAHCRVPRKPPPRRIRPINTGLTGGKAG